MVGSGGRAGLPAAAAGVASVMNRRKQLAHTPALNAWGSLLGPQSHTPGSTGVGLNGSSLASPPAPFLAARLPSPAPAPAPSLPPPPLPLNPSAAPSPASSVLSWSRDESTPTAAVPSPRAAWKACCSDRGRAWGLSVPGSGGAGCVTLAAISGVMTASHEFGVGTGFGIVLAAPVVGLLAAAAATGVSMAGEAVAWVAGAGAGAGAGAEVLLADAASAPPAPLTAAAAAAVARPGCDGRGGRPARDAAGTDVGAGVACEAAAAAVAAARAEEASTSLRSSALLPSRRSSK